MQRPVGVPAERQRVKLQRLVGRQHQVADADKAKTTQTAARIGVAETGQGLATNEIVDLRLESQQIRVLKDRAFQFNGNDQPALSD